MLRIDSRLPLIWRTPTSCQLGTLDPCVVLENLTPAHERLLDAVREGAAVVTLVALANQARLSPREREEFLGILAPALETPSIPRRRILIAGDGPGRGEIKHVLEDGAELADDKRDVELDRDVDIAVLVASYFVSGASAGPWLRRDIPHLLVSFDERGANVGPLVIPGHTPCAHCIDLHRRDADASWVAMASQLTYVEHPSPSAALRCAVAVEVADVLARHQDPPHAHHTGGTYVRINTTTGFRDNAAIDFHPDCRCRSLQENVTSLASRRATRNSVPTTASAVGPRA